MVNAFSQLERLVLEVTDWNAQRAEPRQQGSRWHLQSGRVMWVGRNACKPRLVRSFCK